MYIIFGLAIKISKKNSKLGKGVTYVYLGLSFWLNLKNSYHIPEHVFSLEGQMLENIAWINLNSMQIEKNYYENRK